jgi:predicted MFS family arabinose efflux permease
MAFLSQAGFSGSRVAVSLHALQLSDNELAIGAVIALYALCPMLLSIAIGRVADRLPPRRLVLAGSIAMTAALLLPPFAPLLASLCLSALVLGLFHQVFSLPIEALVGGIGGPSMRARNYAVITMAWSLSNFVGPVMAGYAIDYLGRLEAYFVLAAFTTAPLLILAVRPGLLPKSIAVHGAGGAEARGSVLELWRIPSLRMAVIAAGIVGSAQDLCQFYMPIYGTAINLSASAIGTILGIVAFAAFVIRAILPFLAKKLTESQILGWAIFASAAAFALFPFFVNPYALGAIAFLLGLGVGCAMPMTMSLLYIWSPPNRIAEAFGLQKTVRNISHLAVPIVFGSVGAAFGNSAVFFSNTVMLAVSGLLLRKANKRGQTPKPTGLGV